MADSGPSPVALWRAQVVSAILDISAPAAAAAPVRVEMTMPAMSHSALGATWMAAVDHRDRVGLSRSALGDDGMSDPIGYAVELTGSATDVRDLLAAWLQVADVHSSGDPWIGTDAHRATAMGVDLNTTYERDLG